MQRLIEQPVGEGDVLDGDTPVGRVHYHLAVYRHYSDNEGESVPLQFEIEGRISATDTLSLVDLDASEALTLCLADGRRLDFHLLNDGSIRSTGLGLYRADR